MNYKLTNTLLSAILTLLIINTLNCSFLSRFFIINNSKDKVTISYHLSNDQPNRFFSKLPSICNYELHHKNHKLKMENCRAIEKLEMDTAGWKMVKLFPGECLSFGGPINKYFRPEEPAIMEAFNLEGIVIFTADEQIRLEKPRLLTSFEPLKGIKNGYGLWISPENPGGR